MKKIFLLALLAIVSVTAFARKSYIAVYNSLQSGEAPRYSSKVYLTGDVPDNIEGFAYSETYHDWYNDGSAKIYSIGEVLNVLSEYGYEVEFTNNNQYFLLSKEIPSNQTALSGDVNKDGRVNVSDVTTLVNIILGIVRDNPSLLEQIK